MLDPERGEHPEPMERWLQLGFPDGTPQERVQETFRIIADHLFEGASFDHTAISEFGTIHMTVITLTGFRELKPRDQLSPEELEARNLYDEHFQEHEEV